jgi:hypothetical protein
VKRIQAGPEMNGPSSSAGQVVWFVGGEAYVEDTHPYVRWAYSRPGAYAVTDVDQAPPEYLDAVTRMHQRSGHREPATR